MKKKNIVLEVGIIVLLVVCLCLVVVLIRVNKSKEKDRNQTETSATSEMKKDAVTKLEDDSQIEEGVRVTYTNSNSWDNNGKVNQQIDVVLSNETKGDIGNWELSFSVPEGTTIEQSWNGTFKVDGRVLTVVPEAYNQAISMGSEVTFGLILGTQEAFTPTATDTHMKADGNEVNIVMEKESLATKEDVIQSEGDTEEWVTTQETAISSVGTPVEQYGKLRVSGVDLVDESGAPVQLKGVSTHGIAWFPEYVNKEAFQCLRDSYGVNVVRLALYSNPSDGYNEETVKKVEEGVSYATELGMYVLIDWHILNDNNPNDHKKEAKTFFKRMANKYKDQNNVLYEICNEPNGAVTWADDIKPYAESVLKTIRSIDSDGVVIVGTPTWSQDVDVVAKDPIKDQSNVMYTLHFYAATHKEDLRNKFVAARKEGLPIFVTEFSICDASGNGALDIESANAWMKLLNENKISYCAWSLCNKAESSALLKSDCTKQNDFKKEDFSEAGKWFIDQLLGK